MLTREQIGEMVRDNPSKLGKLAYRQLGSVPDAEDAAQDALVLALRNREQFRGESALSTWLGTIVINCSRTKKRRKRLDDQELSDFLLESHPSNECSADAGLILAEDLQALRRAIGRLSPALRSVVELRLRESKIADIANELGLPLGTAKARMSRAIERLRFYMRNDA